MQDNKKIAKEWFALIRKMRKFEPIAGEKIIRFYQEFIWSWLALVFLLKREGRKEKDGIRDYFENLNAQKINEIMSDGLLDRINELSNMNIENRSDRSAEDRYAEATVLKNAIRDGSKKEILKNTLLLLYVVRCNLFHGDKTWTEQRDKAIMFIASDIMKRVMGQLLV